MRVTVEAKVPDQLAWAGGGTSISRGGKSPLDRPSAADTIAAGAAVARLRPTKPGEPATSACGEWEALGPASGWYPEYSRLNSAVSGTVFIPPSVGISNWITGCRTVDWRKSGQKSGGAEPLLWICRHRVGRSKSGRACAFESWKKTAWNSSGLEIASKKLRKKTARTRRVCPPRSPAARPHEIPERSRRLGSCKNPPPAFCSEHRGVILRVGPSKQPLATNTQSWKQRATRSMISRMMFRPGAPLRLCDVVVKTPDSSFSVSAFQFSAFVLRLCFLRELL